METCVSLFRDVVLAKGSVFPRVGLSFSLSVLSKKGFPCQRKAPEMLRKALGRRDPPKQLASERETWRWAWVGDAMTWVEFSGDLGRRNRSSELPADECMDLLFRV